MLIYFAQLGTQIIHIHDLALTETHFAFSILALTQTGTYTHISSLSALLFISATVLVENLLSAWARFPRCSHPEKTLTEPGAALWASTDCCPFILFPNSYVSLPTATIGASVTDQPSYIHQKYSAPLTAKLLLLFAL